MLPNWVDEKIRNKSGRVRKHHDGLMICCPWHGENNPSMIVNYYNKSCWCFSCQKWSTLNGLFKKLKIDYQVPDDRVFQPQEELVGEGYKLDVTKNLPFVPSVYEKRGITEESVRKYKLKYNGKNMILPVYFHQLYKGYLKRQDGKIKYLVCDGLSASTIVWGWDDINPKKLTFVTEGIFDAICFRQLGFQSIALLGKMWKNKEYLKLLEDPVWVNDNGDEHSVRVFSTLRSKYGGRMLLIPYQHKDINDWYLADKKGLLESCQSL